MMTQHKRRGEDWLLLKGGFNRVVPERAIEVLTKAMKKGKLTTEIIEEQLDKVSSEDQMLLLNLLGGRLPLGYRLAGTSPKEVSESMLSRLDRILRRCRRVAEMLDIKSS